jgi:hypothetical protein
MYIATQELKKKAREPNWMNRQIFIINLQKHPQYNETYSGYGIACPSSHKGY